MSARAVVLCAALLFSAEVRAQTPFERGGRWGYRDARGAVLIPPRFRAAERFSPGGIALVTDERGLAYIDRGGRVVVRPFVYDNGPDYFQQGLARFVQAGKMGFFDARGRVVIPARFTFATPFTEGLAAFCEGCGWKEEGEHRVVTGGRWGFVDRAGRVVVVPRYAEALPFERGRARVRTDTRWVYVDARGRVLGPAPAPGEAS